MTTDDPTTHAAGATPAPGRRPPGAGMPIVGAPTAGVPVEAAPLEAPRLAVAPPPPTAGATRRTGGFTPLRPAAPSYPSGTPAAHRPDATRDGNVPPAEAAPAPRALPVGHGAGAPRLGSADIGTAPQSAAPNAAEPSPPASAPPAAAPAVTEHPYATRPAATVRQDGPGPEGTGMDVSESAYDHLSGDVTTVPGHVVADEPASGDDRPPPDQDAAPGPEDRAATDAALVEAVLGETSGTEQADGDEDADERMRTLIWTAATYRPLDEVVALVTQLKEAKAVDSPADEALRAAAVARPLEEVRQLVAMLNEAGHTLDENDTALRAAAVGRPIEDVVELVGILGPAQGSPAPSRGAGAAASTGSSPVPEDPRLRPPRTATVAAAPAPTLEVKTLTPPSDGDAAAPARRSVLRWPAAAALFACGAIHLPTDLAALWTGGYTDGLALAVAVLCLVVGEWLIVRESVRVWGSVAALALGVVALHGMTGSSGVNLLRNSLGHGWPLAGAAAVALAMVTALLAASALLRRQNKPATAEDT